MALVPDPAIPTFCEIYDQSAKFVGRALSRLGIADAAIEDVMQEVFMVVHRRLPEFQARSSVRTWIYGIAVRVARNHRRLQARRRIGTTAIDPSIEPATLAERSDRAPDAALAKVEAARLVNRLLNELDDELREIFVLNELEEMSAPEIGEALALNTNTVYSRLRAARRAFEDALARAKARDEWRLT